MKEKNIDGWSWFYWTLKYLLAAPVLRTYYKRISTINAHKIPENAPIILAANHQNALMDAIAVLYAMKKQPIFVARADIFKKPLAIKFLTLCKIMPIFRIRDGAENLKNNDETFDKTVGILERKINPFAILPEGNHGGKRRLRSLQKGIFRIALKAQEAYGNKPGVKIIPIGIDYEDYENVYSDLFVNFGEPIEVSKYWDDYQENPARTINQMRSDLSEAIKKQMIHIETEEYYDTYLALRKIYNKNMRRNLKIKSNSLISEFLADKEMIRILDLQLEKDSSQVDEIHNMVNEYEELKNQMGLPEQTFAHSINLSTIFIKSILFLVGSPLFLLGMLNNFLAYFVPSIILPKIKDRQFHATVKYAIGMILTIVSFIFFGTLAIIFLPFLWLKILYISTLLMTGKFSLWYAYHLRLTLSHWKFNMLKMKKNSSLLKAISLRSKIISSMNNLSKNH